MRSLVLCEACKHHVKVSETQCPFCGVALLARGTPAATRARGIPGGRAALFLAGTALASGCADDAEPAHHKDDAGSPGTHDAGKDASTPHPIDAGRDSSQVMSTPPYGIALPLPDSGILDASCPQVGRLPAPAYGVAVDSGARADQCTEAGHDAGPIVFPPYGIAIDPNG